MRNGANGSKGQLQLGIQASGDCTGDGLTTDHGWTEPSLEHFLAFAATQGVRIITVWTENAFEIPRGGIRICDWFVPTLLRWARDQESRHEPPIKNDDAAIAMKDKRFKMFGYLTDSLHNETTIPPPVLLRSAWQEFTAVIQMGPTTGAHGAAGALRVSGRGVGHLFLDHVQVNATNTSTSQLKTDDAAAGIPLSALASLLQYSGIDGHPQSSIPADAATTFFVDCTDGSDELDGRSAPTAVRSLSHAQMLLRHLLRQRKAQHVENGTGAPVVVEIRGTCHLWQSLQLTALDAGTADAPVVWRGADAGATISGGQRIEAWESVEWPGAPFGAVLRANVSHWPIDVKTLRVALPEGVSGAPGSSWIDRTRWPKAEPSNYSAGWLATAPWTEQWCKHHGARTCAGSGWAVGLSKSVPLDVLADSANLYVNVFGQSDEKDVLNQIKRVEWNQPGLSAEANRSLHVMLARGAQPGTRFFLENVRSSLAEGEFFVDHRGRAGGELPHQLYVWPKPEWINRNNSINHECLIQLQALCSGPRRVSTGSTGVSCLVCAGVYESLLKTSHCLAADIDRFCQPSKSTAAPSFVAVAPMDISCMTLQGSHHTVLLNLSFSDSGYESEGCWCGPAGHPSDAAVVVRASNNVRIEACSFVSGIAGYAVAATDGSLNLNFIGNAVQSAGQGGVILYGGLASYWHRLNATGPVHTQPDGAVITHNLVSHSGRILKHVSGVDLSGASGALVAHNRIEYMPRYGLATFSFVGSKNSYNNVFEKNQIYAMSLETDDTGAIYFSATPGCVGISTAACMASIDWNLNNTIRFNNITRTVGAASLDGVHVCVGGDNGGSGPAGLGCRNISATIYFDGGDPKGSGYVGSEVYGNIIETSTAGAFFITGGNVNASNNIFLANSKNRYGTYDTTNLQWGVVQLLSANSATQNKAFPNGGKPGSRFTSNIFLTQSTGQPVYWG